MLVAQSCPTLCDPMDCSPPRLLCPWDSAGKNMSGLPFSSPEDLPNPGIEPKSPALQVDPLPSESVGKPWTKNRCIYIYIRVYTHIYELPDIQAGFQRGRGTTDQIANIHWIMEKAREFQKNIYLSSTDYEKPLTVWITINCGKFLEMGKPEYFIYLLRYMYMGQEATVRIGHGTTDWFKVGKGIWQGCILSLCVFNFYTENIRWNAGLGEAQAGFKIARRNINNLRYADVTTLIAESEEELNSLLMRVKENEKVGLKLNIQKTKIMASGPITTWQTEGEKVEAVADFIFFVSRITVDSDCSHEI